MGVEGESWVARALRNPYPPLPPAHLVILMKASLVHALTSLDGETAGTSTEAKAAVGVVGVYRSGAQCSR